MKRSKSGIIAILAQFENPEFRKVLDLKITSGFPTITLPLDFKTLLNGQSKELVGYQHITIPPDLNIHITGNNQKRIWAGKIDGLVNKDGELTVDYKKIITVIFPPINDFSVFTNKSYHGAEIIAFSQLPHWNKFTSFVLEIFALKNKDVSINTNDHYRGDQGALQPFKYSSIGKTFDRPFRQGNFYLRPFSITNHDPKPLKTVIIIFGD